MPASVRGKKRDQSVFVRCNPVFGFGWKTRDLSEGAGISSADLKSGLGHMTVAEAIALANIVLVSGANAPKPMRVTKKIPNAPNTASASISTYCGFDKLASANAQGFFQSGRAKTVSLSAPRASRRTFSGVVTLSNGLMYVQPVDAVAATAERRATLGIEIASQISATDGQKLARGCRSKPGRVDVALEGDVTARLPFSTAKQNDAGALGSIVQMERIEYQ